MLFRFEAKLRQASANYLFIVGRNCIFLARLSLRTDKSMNRVSLRSDLEIRPKFNDPVIPVWKQGSSAMDGASIARKYLLLDSRANGMTPLFALVAWW
uniref:Uncharacterized protein n=1 Tax=Candidatus Kentrum sp. SD TaxID=2126332 RepID=A0A450YAL8_9GAMM|nr:MAG: hypothetical protein BECKSD772F_GA0070984_102611 [Candidatus Kentron sp. SD]